MAEIKLTLTVTELGNSALRGVAQRAESTGPVMRIIAGYLVSSSQLRFVNQQGPDGAAWPALKHRSGQAELDSGIMRASIHGESTSDQAAAATNAKQAKLQNFGSAGLPGGMVKPVFGGGALAIPVSPAAKGKSPREFPDLFVLKRKGGRTAMLARSVGGRHARVELMFALSAGVRIPARPFMGINETDTTIIGQMVRNYLTKRNAG